MPTPALVIFDDGLGSFGPLTDLRAAFELRTGVLTTAGRIILCRPEPLVAYWVDPALAAVVAERAKSAVNKLDVEGEVLCVNGRWANPDLQTDPGPGQVLRTPDGETVLLARLVAADAVRWLSGGPLPDGVNEGVAGGAVLYRHPWDILRELPRAIGFDIQATRQVHSAVPRRVDVIGEHPVEVHATAKILPNVVLDAELGPIRIHEGVTIRPGAVLCGPCSVGRDTTVIDHALIKPNTVIGPVCKVAGEVGGTVFQGYSNKSHDGHLGDSFVGKWVNIGAGTTNSNLLNTYGEVTMRVESDGPMHRTGMTYVGSFIGDHVKLAIETRIMTGVVIGTGAMIATPGYVSGVVQRFAWITEAGERRFRFDKFLETTRAMMSRREREASAAYVERLRVVHAAACGSS